MAFYTIKLKTIIIWIVLLSAAAIAAGVWLCARPPVQDAPNPAPAELPPEPEQPPEPEEAEEEPEAQKKYIKWVEFNVCYNALETAMQMDIDSHDTDAPLNWIELLAYLGAKYGGDFSRYKQKDLTGLAERLQAGEDLSAITAGMEYYPYYLEAYTAVLSQYVGNYKVQTADENGSLQWEERYGLRAFSPIAGGYGYSDYDDFGSSRTYGYTRRHLGHDMMGSIGTPVIAVEGGIVECVGWNQYGGWRIGIRSFDSKRYYYYAHLRKDHPYHSSLQAGSTVKAGDVIGYLGMTGYSTKENTNNINTPHLHFGMQLIFDESQKDGVNQIWIDCYNLTKLLQKNKSAVVKNEEEKEYYRKYDFELPEE